MHLFSVYDMLATGLQSNNAFYIFYLLSPSVTLATWSIQYVQYVS